MAGKEKIKAFVGCEHLDFFIKQRGIWCDTASHSTNDLKEVILEDREDKVQVRACILVYFALQHLTPEQKALVARQILRPPSRRSLLGLPVTKTPYEDIQMGNNNN